jgi:hypothetical protein
VTTRNWRIEVSFDPFFAGNPSAKEKLLLKTKILKNCCYSRFADGWHAVIDANIAGSGCLLAAETGFQSVSTRYSKTLSPENLF